MSKSKFFAAAAIAVCVLGFAVGAYAQQGGRQATTQQFPALTPGVPTNAVVPGFFRVNVPAAGNLTVWTTGEFLDTTGQIFDANGELITSDDDGGDNTNTRVSALVSAGTYYVGIGTYGGGTGAAVIHMEISR